jgi:hypothetical protein
MIINNNTNFMKYFLAYDVKLNIYYYNELLPGCEVETGLPNLELINTLDELKNRLQQLGQTWVDPNNEIEETI